MKSTRTLFAIKVVFAALAIVVAMGNFSPHTWLWGFDHFVVGMPFGFKSVWSFSLLVAIALYPFFWRRNEFVDSFFALVSIAALSFLLGRAYLAVIDGFSGVSMQEHYLKLGYEGNAKSIFFEIESRIIVLAIMSCYLLWILRSTILGTKEVGFILLAILCSTAFTINAY